MAYVVGLCGAEHLTFHFSMMLEHAWMALQARDALGISLAQDRAWIEGAVVFYDSFYRAECRKRTGSETGPDGRARSKVPGSTCCAKSTGIIFKP